MVAEVISRLESNPHHREGTLYLDKDQRGGRLFLVLEQEYETLKHWEVLEKGS